MQIHRGGHIHVMIAAGRTAMPLLLGRLHGVWALNARGHLPNVTGDPLETVPHAWSTPICLDCAPAQVPADALSIWLDRLRPVFPAGHPTVSYLWVAGSRCRPSAGSALRRRLRAFR